MSLAPRTPVSLKVSDTLNPITDDGSAKEIRATIPLLLQEASQLNQMCIALHAVLAPLIGLSCMSFFMLSHTLDDDVDSGHPWPRLVATGTRRARHWLRIPRVRADLDNRVDVTDAAGLGASISVPQHESIVLRPLEAEYAALATAALSRAFDRRTWRGGGLSAAFLGEQSTFDWWTAETGRICVLNWV